MSVEIDPPKKRHLMESYFTISAFPDVEPALKELQPSTLGILSNGTPMMLQEALEHSRLADHFTHVISVDQVRLFKPRPEVYRLVTETLGISASEVLYVSAHSFDVMGAKNVGFRAVYVNRRGIPMDPLGVEPDYEISSFADLPEIARSVSF